MGLRTKAVIAVNIVVIFACILTGFIGYNSAVDGFAKALGMKAESDANSILEIMDDRFKGDWKIISGELYKGETKIDDAENIVDELAKISGGKVTFFKGDTRVATNVKDASGSRAVGTKASEIVIDTVIKGGQNFLGEANVMGEEHYAAYRPIKNSSGAVIGMIFVGISLHEIDDVVNKFLFLMVAAIVTIIVVCVLASNFVIGKGISMLDEIIDAMQKISKGNLKINNLEIRTDDEIGALAQGVNAMRKELQDLIKNVSQSADKVSSSSQELSAVTRQATDSISFMAQSTAAMGEDASVLAYMVNDLEEIIHDMRNKMHILHESSNAMDEVAKGSASNAAIGKEKSDFAINVMKTVSEGVQDSARIVGELGKRSDEIGQIVGTISNIAAQTNLLALNAAIEAARAGEHGRGFAVVADEVRKLAEQSGEAASNIAELIHSIQEDTNSAVESIEKGALGVKEGMESVLAIGEAFKGIEEQAEKLSVNVKSSREYIEAVNTSSHEILDSVENVHEITSKTEEVSNSVTDSANKQSETIQEISDASQGLSQLATDMQNEVTKFAI